MSVAALEPEAEAPAQAASAADWTRIYLGFGGMVLGQFMAMLDTQIVNSSLTEIQNGIGASADEISWVQTIYILAEVVVMPLVAYLSKLFGTRRFYATATAAFVLASIATGLSGDLDMMIVTRALQGAAAGAMIPPVLATAMTVFPIERRISAQMLTTVVIALAPTIGPTLGGHLTDALSWRWLFFINIGPGLVVMFLVSRYADFDKPNPHLGRGVDWIGAGAMAAFLLSMQYVLEEGASDGWFQDDRILWLTVLSVLAGVLFVWRELVYRQPIVSLRPFRNRNFVLGAFMSVVSGMGLFGGSFALPLYMAQVMRYSPSQVGTTMAVSGLTMFVFAPLTGRIVRTLDLRVGMVLGFGLATIGSALGIHITADWGWEQFAVLQAVRSLGVTMCLVAATQLTLSTIPPHMMKDASGLATLIRNVGGAVGIAMIATLLTHQSAVHLDEISSGVSIASLKAQTMLDHLTTLMQTRGTADPEGAAYKAFHNVIAREARVLAFGDAFAFVACATAIAGSLALVTGPVHVNRGVVETGADD